MGRSGSKSRKTHKKPQHLPKVGESAHNHTSMHTERKGVMDATGLSGLSKGTRAAVVTIVTVALIGAVFALLLLTLR
jgi:hypothetical protein